MSKITSITDIHLYIGMGHDADEQKAAIKLLDAAGVKYTTLVYNDQSAHIHVFTALNTWSWGATREVRNGGFTKMPIVHWVEHYDDLFEMHFNTQGLNELKAATSLLKNGKLTK